MNDCRLTYRAMGAFAVGLALAAGCRAQGQVFTERFDDDAIDPRVWRVDLYGRGPMIGEINQELEFTMPPESTGVEFGARLVSRFLLRGDFDIRVEFRLLEWPLYNGVRTAIGLTDDLYDDYGVERTSLSASEPLGAHEVYVADFGPFVLVDTHDFAGAMRLVRSGDTQTGYYLNGGEWIAIQTDSAPTEDLAIQLHAYSHDYAFQHHEVRAAFDNFTVKSGELIWAPCAQTADLNRDGRVNFADFVIFLDDYITADSRADFTSDGLVDFSDYLEFLNLFEAGC